MARRRSITPRFGIEDEILAAPIASISDIATKLEIITSRAELFDVSDDLERLHDQNRGIPRWRKPRPGAMELACHIEVSPFPRRSRRTECLLLALRWGNRPAACG